MSSLVRRAGIASVFLFSTACGGFGTDVPDGGPSYVGIGGHSGGTGGASAAGGSATGGGGGAAQDGSAGNAGSAGTGGGKPIIKSYTFDTGVETWAATYTSAASDKMTIATSAVRSSFNSGDGQPNPGSLQLDIPYASGGQYVAAGIVLAATPADITGRVVTARVKIVSGLETATDLMNSPAGAKIYVKSTMGYIYVSGAPANLTSTGIWTLISFDYSHPGYIDPNIDAASFDPADIRELGIQIDSGGQAPAAQPAVVLIDTVAY